VRRIAVLFLVEGFMAYAQTTLPPTSPTSLPVATPPPGAALSARPAVPPRIGVTAKVSYNQGQLLVIADNSSLNQILRQISRLTGMTITGGVADQRVFGQYGPAPPAQILGDLLEGTGSNMLLRETAAAAPAELILTAREGGVTPPNPNAPGFDDDSSSNDAPSNDAPVAPPPDQNLPGQRSQRLPYNTLPDAPSGAPTAATPGQISNSSIVTSPAPSNPASPNGVLTPEQIYQQLQQLQKTQPQQ
jgi:hypothetical protein